MTQYLTTSCALPRKYLSLHPCGVDDVIPRKGKAVAGRSPPGRENKQKATKRPNCENKMSKYALSRHLSSFQIEGRLPAMEGSSTSWGLVRCIKFAVYGAVCGQIVLILIRKYRFVIINSIFLCQYFSQLHNFERVSQLCPFITGKLALQEALTSGLYQRQEQSTSLS